MEETQEIINLIKGNKIYKARKKIYELFKNNLKLFYYYIALTYCAEGQYEFAVECFKLSIRNGLNSYIAYYNLGVSYIEINENKKAVDCFVNSIKFKKDYLKSYLCLIDLLNNLGENKNAYRVLKTATIYCESQYVYIIEKKYYDEIIKHS